MAPIHSLKNAPTVSFVGRVRRPASRSTESFERAAFASRGALRLEAGEGRSRRLANSIRIPWAFSLAVLLVLALATGLLLGRTGDKPFRPHKPCSMIKKPSPRA